MSSTARASKTKSPARAGTRTNKKTEKPNREHMIAEAAYYIAMKRGFAEGDQVQDWLTAEFQIDQLKPVRKRQAAAR